MAIVSNSGCTRAVPVNAPAGATRDGCVPAPVTTIPGASCARADAEHARASATSVMTIRVRGP